MKCCVRGMSAVCQATNMCTDHTDNEWNMLWHLRQSKLLSEVLISGTGVSCGTTVTNPIDVIKTRMQLHPGTNAGVDKPGLVATGVAVVREDGLLGLWKGWSPAVLRAMVYGGLRLGLYNPIKATLQNLDSSCTGMGQHSSHVNTNYEASSSSSRPETSSSSSSSTSSSSSGAGAKATDVSRKLMAGVISGSSAAALLSPTELVKVRLQASNCQQTSATQVVAAVVKDQGLKGLWKGATPGVVRAAVLTSSQCATYDETKSAVMHYTGWSDHTGTHLATSMVTGVISTTATNPVDVIKTNMFVGGTQHSGPLACAASLHKAHGLAGFYRGWLANYARLGPQTVVTFLVVEQLRQLAGMKPL